MQYDASDDMEEAGLGAYVVCVNWVLRWIGCI
jgi:hypothetical protein